MKHITWYCFDHIDEFRAPEIIISAINEKEARRFLETRVTPENLLKIKLISCHLTQLEALEARAERNKNDNKKTSNDS